MRPGWAAALLAALAALLSACTEPPDLSPVAESLAPGTAGLGAARMPDRVARAPFGAHIARAVMADPAIARSGSEIRAARAEKTAADRALFPEVRVGISSETRVIDDLASSGASPFLRVSQLVYDAGAAQADQTAAEARVLQSRARRIETAAQTALSAVEAYRRLITGRRLLALAEENLTELRRIADRIAERGQRGAGSRADTLTARSRVADAETRLVEARARLDKAQAAFRRVFADIPADLPPPVNAPPLPSDAEEVLDQSPRLRAANARVKLAQSEHASARARRRPALELGATGRRASSGGGSDIEIDLTLDYSFDTRGDLGAAIESAAARVDAARAARDTLRREVREALATVRSDQDAGEARVAAAREAVETNAASLAAARDQFRIGRRTLVDLLDAQHDLVRAREIRIRAEQDRFLTDYAALALTGDILDLFDIELPGVQE